MGFLFEYGHNSYYSREDLVWQPISEFNTAIRLGAASNDDRNLASFVSLEDARGGIGTVFGSVREDIDKLGDNDGVVALKMNQAIKPPKIWENIVTGSDKADGTRAVFYEPSGFDQVMLGWGEKVYFSSVAGEQVTWNENGLAPYASGEKISQFLLYTEPETGTKRIWIAGEGGEALKYVNDPEDATATEPAAGMIAEMLFEWDSKLYASSPGELWWSIRPTVLSDWNATAPIGAWPNRSKFVGGFPFGETILPYVLAEYHDPGLARLVVFDLDAFKVIPITLGLSGIVDAFSMQGKICIVHDYGRAATLYDPRSNTQAELNWRAEERDGFVAARDGAAVGGVGHTRGPFLFSALDDSAESQIFLYKGTGWHPYGRAVTGVTVPGGYYSTREQRFYMPLERGDETAIRVADIVWWSEAFQPGEDQSVTLEPEDLSFYTPWFDMGFAEIAGPLLTVSHGGYADDMNTVTVEYQLDLDASEWLMLGVLPGSSPPEPEITGRIRSVANDRTLLFNSLSGVSFTRARFRVTLSSSALAPKQTPNAYPLTVRFLKRPDLRRSCRIAIDVSETIAHRPDLTGFDDLWQELEALYDQRIVPKLEAGPVTTWAAMIALPIVMNLDASGEDDVERSTVSNEGSIVISVAELV